MFTNEGLRAAGLIALLLGGAMAVVASDTIVGTQRCRMCHMSQARAMSAFGADTTNSVRMILGRGVAADSKAQGHRPDPTAAQHQRTNLTCETCHGMGSRHVALPVANRDTAARRATINLPGGETCRTCHSPHPIRG